MRAPDRVLFFIAAGDVDTNGVLSLDEFVAIIRNVRPQGFITEAVRMFREASILSEARRARTFTSSSMALLMCLCCVLKYRQVPKLWTH